MTNPYTNRPVTSADYFVPARGGRGELAGRLLRQLLRADPPPDCVSLVGERRFGKTSLLGYLERALQGTPNLCCAGVNAGDVVRIADLNRLQGTSNLFLASVNMLNLPQQNPVGFYAVLTRAFGRAGLLPAGHPPLGPLELEEVLQDWSRDGRRLVLFLDEFDAVARHQEFPLAFFDHLRSIANQYPLTLVVASVAPLGEIAHAGVFGSPFFNIFNREQLGPLSLAEAEALICHPPGGQEGVGEVTSIILALAGRHPFLLQRACSCAWDLREAGGGRIDLAVLRSQFAAAVQDHCQYIWDHCGPAERQTLCALVKGETRSAGAGLPRLMQRGYVRDGEQPQLDSECFEAFVRRQCTGPMVGCLLSDKPAEAEPAQPPVPRESLTVTTTAPVRRIALVLGVNQHRNQRSGSCWLPPLQYAERDAEEIAALFTALGFEVRRLLGPQATRAALEDAFTAMHHATATAPHPESCFVFHFSGHGQIDRHDDETAYLVLQDTDPVNLAGTGLEMTQLVYQFLPRVRVPNALVLLDACHAGFAAGVKDMVAEGTDWEVGGRLSNVTQQLFTGLRGRMVLAACAGAAQAREKASLGHGVFTYYILKHWRDLDGHHPPDQITFASLIDYVGQRMPQDHPELPLPVFNGTGLGGSLVLRRI
jgi:hypothetical protein